MNAIDVIRQGFDHLHEAARADIREMQPGWWWWEPSPGMNHIGFLFWHLVRDEDTVVNWVTRQPQIWAADAWHQRFGLDPREQGTGYEAEEAAGLRYDPVLFQSYADAVWERTGSSLARITDDDLDRAAWKDSPWNIGRQLVEGCLGHAWLHLGEIRLLMGLKGWRFRE